MIIQGVSGAGDFAGSQLFFVPGIDGIVIETVFTSAVETDIQCPNGTVDPFGQGHGDMTVIRDLSVKSLPASSPFTFNEDEPLTASPSHTGHEVLLGNGIFLKARARIENCQLDGFRYDGIHIETIDVRRMPTTGKFTIVE